MTKLRQRLDRLRDERGFTLAYVMLFMLVGSLFAVAAWGSVNSDTKQTASDKNGKAAYAAAESGLNWYLYRLNQDNAVWTDCETPLTLPDGSANPVNQPWNGSGADPRQWRPMPGNPNAQFTIELVPQNGNAKCLPDAQAEASMLDSTGAMTIRATGKVGTTKRTVVAQLRRAGFLDFLYFTDFETMDPTVFQVSNPGLSQVPCNVYRRDGRDSRCTDIVFAGSDTVKGPFHTNDNFLACGSPTFGRTKNDAVEESDPGGFKSGCGGTATPNFLGTYSKGTQTLQMPVTNASLKDVTLAQNRFTGQTRLQLNGTTDTIDVYNPASSTTKTTIPWPTNGILYVDSSCTDGYDIVQKYADQNCNGDVYVRGTYKRSLTIASADDVVILGNITKTGGNATLGLIGEGFVRVYHPVLPNNRTTQTCTSTNTGTATSGTTAVPFGIPSPSNVTIDAAVMSVKHSFIVDNYYCGGTLGTLTVNGAIAQRYRGPVGTGGATISTGYIKNYNYDDRFRVVNPPFFLDPVNSAWRLVRFNEQTPAT